MAFKLTDSMTTATSSTTTTAISDSKLTKLIEAKCVTLSQHYTHTQSRTCMSTGCKTAPHNLLNLANSLPQPHNTTLLHEFYLTTTQILEYTPTQRLPTRLPHGLYANDGVMLACFSYHKETKMLWRNRLLFVANISRRDTEPRTVLFPHQ